MLVLSRKVGERLLVGKDIVILVTQIRGDKVRIGIEAPPEYRVVREELEQKGKDDEVRD
jgi:carbon storage regulator